MDETKLEMTFKISLENFHKLDKLARTSNVSFDEIVNNGIETVYDVVIEGFEIY